MSYKSVTAETREGGPVFGFLICASYASYEGIEMLLEHAVSLAQHILWRIYLRIRLLALSSC
jgi:hypothetical protein